MNDAMYLALNNKIKAVGTDVNGVSDNVQVVSDKIGTPSDGASTVFSKFDEVVTKLDGLSSSSGGGSGAADVMTLVEALESSNANVVEWAFEQEGIGTALNVLFGLDSDVLANCNTVDEIAQSDAALGAINSNTDAFNLCSNNNETLNYALAVYSMTDDEKVLVAGNGYSTYSVGDLLTLTWNNTATQFRVVHKGYKTSNKIVLVSENILAKTTWHSSANNYSSSNLRTYLNSTVLSGFNSLIQDAIVTTAVACHNKATAVTCNDKIWALSYAEAGLGTNTYAPAEGSALSYFNSATRRVKKYNGTADYWWLRTPYSYNTYRAWLVRTDGSADNLNVSGSYGVVPAFEI